MKKNIMLLVLMFTWLPLDAQKLSLQEREILQLQDQRSLGNGKLIKYLSNKSPKLRYRGAIALANIQDTTAVHVLISVLQDRVKNVRAAAAFALGQIGTSTSENGLLEMLSKEHDPFVQARILEALGKCGGVEGFDALLKVFEIKKIQLPLRDFALSIGRFAIRGIKTEQSIWKCFELVNNKVPKVQAAALYALWRSSPSGLIDLEISQQKDQLMRLSTNRNMDVRMHLATLLGRSKSKDADEILDALEKTEIKYNDWHVWVQIVRARATLRVTDKDILEWYPQYLSMKNEYVRIATLQALASISSATFEKSKMNDTLCQTISRIASDSSGEIEAVREEALVAMGNHCAEKLTSIQSWISENNISSRLKAKMLEAIAQQTTRRNFDILLSHLNHDSLRVAMAAWDFIKRMLTPIVLKTFGFDSTAEADLPNLILQQAKIGLARNDIGITTVVANLFADTTIFRIFKDAQLTDRVIDALIAASGGVQSPDNAETVQAIFEALKNIGSDRAVPFLENMIFKSDRNTAIEAAFALSKITGKDYLDRIPRPAIPNHTNDDWKLLESIQLHQRVRITTNRGEIVLELQKEHAPFTVLNFIKLIQRRFYNGLSFHRVVPNFVIQGGDPRGDGWGGPAYKIRTEVSLINFEQGSCGMASAGKDTEGSQFFITHVPTPHLDGRYSNFAIVRKGMDVVDQIQSGDTILSMRLIQ